ncbi:MAG: SGNH/GDSL hydrolase family protein [Solirubrobacterales bacterium]|nr:SGNH/GDSL hydrolase family protein [Solirubrobacterales bacterium]
MKRVLGGLGLAVAGFVALLVVEAILARRGEVEGFTGPSSAPHTFGDDGPELAYVVIGDSTGAGQGAPYESGVAVGSARHLAAAGRRVTLVNLAVSGSTMGDVLADQSARAARLEPDVVLIAAGANDVTHLTRIGAVIRDLEQIVARLRATRPGVRIVLTGAPDVGTARRLAQPLRWVAGLRTRQLNRAIAEGADSQGLTFAPIAARTGPMFAEDPTLLAPDRFHPDARGYATWIPVVTEALDRTLRP